MTIKSDIGLLVSEICPLGFGLQVVNRSMVASMMTASSSWFPSSPACGPVGCWHLWSDGVLFRVNQVWLGLVRSPSSGFGLQVVNRSMAASLLPVGRRVLKNDDSEEVVTWIPTTPVTVFAFQDLRHQKR